MHEYIEKVKRLCNCKSIEPKQFLVHLHEFEHTILTLEFKAKEIVENLISCSGVFTIKGSNLKYIWINRLTYFKTTYDEYG
jgi:hypothetical protein